LLFTTAAYALDVITTGLREEFHFTLQGEVQNVVNWCADMNNLKPLCEVVHVTKASAGFADPYYGWQLVKTVGSGVQPLELRVQTLQPEAELSPYTQLGLPEAFPGIPFAFIPTTAPPGTLVCSAIPAIGAGSLPAPQIGLCDVGATPDSASFVLLGPNPGRVIAGDVSAYINTTWQLESADLAVLVPATLTLTEVSTGPYDGESNRVQVDAMFSYGPASKSGRPVTFTFSTEDAWTNDCTPPTNHPTNDEGVVNFDCNLSVGVAADFNITANTPNPAGGADLSAWLTVRITPQGG
jgi:hypothetical protein